jgi:hypothetical protein
MVNSAVNDLSAALKAFWILADGFFMWALAFRRSDV